jgi:uncharacterized hydrophobic protein (TIGR00271 family)
MPAVDDLGLARMRSQLFFDGVDAREKVTRFWVLLVLAAVIATAGVMGDSTATVIGAMIVAPLMTPILGVMLAMVTGDARNLLRSGSLAVAGTLAVIAIGWTFGNLSAVDVIAANNSQVDGRVHPRIIDLVAALATGAVGAFALTRADVSDALPGVAIAISLVPPLAVVGLTLEAGARDESLGALLLFLTNVGAILLSGLIVMGLYRVGAAARGGEPDKRPAWHGRAAVGIVVVFVVLLSVPLGAATFQLNDERLSTAAAKAAAEAWAEPAGWRVRDVQIDRDGLVISVSGPLPAPSPEELRASLDREGLEQTDLKVELIPQEDVFLPAD